MWAGVPTLADMMTKPFSGTIRNLVYYAHLYNNLTSDQSINSMNNKNVTMKL